MTHYTALAKCNLGSSRHLGMPRVNEICFSWQEQVKQVHT